MSEIQRCYSYTSRAEGSKLNIFDWLWVNGDHMNNRLGWFYSMKELWSMEMISILEIIKILLGIIQDLSKLAIFLPQSVELWTVNRASSWAQSVWSLRLLSQSLSLSEINHCSFIRREWKTDTRKYPATDNILSLTYQVLQSHDVLKLVPGLCRATLRLLDWSTLILKPLWAT